MIKGGYILIGILIFLLTISDILASQTFLDEKISYEYGKFTPEIRKSDELTNYFKKLDLQEDYVYVLLEFNNSPTKNQLNELKKDKIKQIGKYSNTH